MTETQKQTQQATGGKTRKRLSLKRLRRLLSIKKKRKPTDTLKVVESPDTDIDDLNANTSDESTAGKEAVDPKKSSENDNPSAGSVELDEDADGVNSVSTKLPGDSQSAISLKTLQQHFIPTFCMLRFGSWLIQGSCLQIYTSNQHQFPYADEPQWSLVRLLPVTGFAVTAFLGPAFGAVVDRFGRQNATRVCCFMLAFSALLTKSSLFLAGQVLNGLGQSLLCAPEAWLVGQAPTLNFSSSALAKTMCLAYILDSLIAPLVRPFVDYVTEVGGSEAPLDFAIGLFVACGLWSLVTQTREPEQLMKIEEDGTKAESKSGWASLKEPKVLFLGCSQMLFEMAMTVFVVHWRFLATKPITQFNESQSEYVVSHDHLFALLTGLRVLGSVYQYYRLNSTTISSTFTPSFKSMAAVAMLSVSFLFSLRYFYQDSVLIVILATFAVFEISVGVFRPSIATLRSKYFSNEHRYTFTNLFQAPSNSLLVWHIMTNQLLDVDTCLAVMCVLLVCTSRSLFLQGKTPLKVD